MIKDYDSYHPCGDCIYFAECEIDWGECEYSDKNWE